MYILLIRKVFILSTHKPSHPSSSQLFQIKGPCFHQLSCSPLYLEQTHYSWFETYILRMVHYMAKDQCTPGHHPLNQPVENPTNMVLSPSFVKRPHSSGKAFCKISEGVCGNLWPFSTSVVFCCDVLHLSRTIIIHWFSVIICQSFIKIQKVYFFITLCRSKNQKT